MELRALQAALPDIQALGASLVAVTPDTGSALADAKRANNLSYQVLSDVDHGVALTFGIVFRVSDSIKDLYLHLGIDLGVRHGNSSSVWLLPVRATYVVDHRGIIRRAALDVDFKKRMEPADMIGALKVIAAEEAKPLGPIQP